MTSPRVLVFGSLNLDLMTRSPRLPQPGETLIGSSFQTIPGGKGGNQAVAAARLGANVAFIGRVGADALGQTMLASLQRSQVDITGITVDDTSPTGMAAIAVDEAGENTIIVVPGANAQVSTGDLAQLTARLPGADCLLLQLEVPLSAVVAAAQLAQAKGVRVILDPAPAPTALPDALYASVDLLTPNQLEASQLTGIPVTDFATASQAGHCLRQRGCLAVLVKLGAAGAVLCTPETTVPVSAYPVEVIDTVAAGDACNGGLAVAWGEGRSLLEASQYAMAVAALAVTRAGAQAALPTAAEVTAFLAQRAR